ncbi:pentatricopeptide repeat-containing protein At4g21170 [Cornus florida]|uniref:pentatricopeptide repeat-containing protein At4g21170 n=1 Tax=Cornus florida TaxID=4283 RepID=UPI002899CAA3|nr:pentatricopeptide repeat-containing protein At4g21170 [Cornus florida]
MPYRKPPIFNRPISGLTKPTPLDWRSHYKQTQLVSQISSTLLQRHNWTPLLRNLNISSKLTPSLFLQILHETQTNPQTSLAFFNWVKSNLGFQPDLETLCKLTQILIVSGLTQDAKPILDSLIQAYPPTQIINSLIQACQGTDSHSPVLSSVVECLCKKGFFLQALEVFVKCKENGYIVSIRSCNALLNVLQQENEIRLAWSFYGMMLRNEVLANQSTLSIIARVLCKDGKFERIVRILDTNIYNSVIYNQIIDCYSKRGDFKAAFDHLTEMCNRKLDAGFSTYSSILDGACRFGDVQLTEMVMDCMVKKGFLSELLLRDYDSIIQKLADLGRTYAADMFLKRACDEKIELQAASYGCLLRAFSNEERVKEAIGIYRSILQSGVEVNESCYNAFVNVLCKEDPSVEVSELLTEMIRRGFVPRGSEISTFINSQCDQGRWKEAEELMNEILEKGFFPDSFCCCSLIEHYCSSKQIDSAMALNNKMEKLEGTLDIATYNLLLNGLFKEKRIEDSVRVFNYMSKKNLISSESFSVMISGLCHEKEFRKAMKLHDQMLKMGLKPDEKSYKRLIYGFK